MMKYNYHPKLISLDEKSHNQIILLVITFKQAISMIDIKSGW